MVTGRREVVVGRAVQLGRAAQEAEALGDHRRAAELYWAAAMLLESGRLNTSSNAASNVQLRDVERGASTHS